MNISAAKHRIEMPELPTLGQVEGEITRIKRQRSFKRAVRLTVSVLLVVAAVAVLISSLILPVLQIVGDSMTPTLQNNEIIALIRTNKFQIGDLCSFNWNNRLLIKRIIAGPGDWVEIDAAGNISVNGQVLDEPYASEKCLGECDLQFPIQVGENQYFLVGDHRNTSIDSRSSVIGNISSDQIIGKVIFRVWPLSELGFVE